MGNSLHINKIRKGDLVKLDIDKCFTMKQGGKLCTPITNHAADIAGVVEGTRLATKADRESWRNSSSSKGIDCAGETKLPPTAYNVEIRRDRVYIVLRARCCPTWSYRKHPGMSLILCTESGEEVYIKRNYLKAV